MESNLAVYEGETPLTVMQIKANVQRIQEVLHQVMKKDVHYGTIPGTPKPTLYKAGAELILTTFHISVDPKAAEITDLSGPDVVHYRIRVEARHQATGILLGAAVGECSSDEEKYRWRRPVCDEEFNETPEDRRREVWKKGKQGSTNYRQKQVRTNPADVANTVLQMAFKRAVVPVTRLVTACSDVFEQDLEDLPEEVRETLMEDRKEAKAPIQQPKAKTATPAPKPADGPKISEAQAKRFYAIAHTEGGNSDDAIHSWLTATYGIESAKEMPKSVYEVACEAASKPLAIMGEAPLITPTDCPGDPANCTHSRYDGKGQADCGVEQPGDRGICPHQK